MIESEQSATLTTARPVFLVIIMNIKKIIYTDETYWLHEEGKKIELNVTEAWNLVAQWTMLYHWNIVCNRLNETDFEWVVDMRC